MVHLTSLKIKKWNETVWIIDIDERFYDRCEWSIVCTSAQWHAVATWHTRLNRVDSCDIRLMFSFSMFFTNFRKTQLPQKADKQTTVRALLRPSTFWPMFASSSSSSSSNDNTNSNDANINDVDLSSFVLRDAATTHSCSICHTCCLVRKQRFTCYHYITWIFIEQIANQFNFHIATDERFPSSKRSTNDNWFFIL